MSIKRIAFLVLAAALIVYVCLHDKPVAELQENLVQFLTIFRLTFLSNYFT